MAKKLIQKKRTCKFNQVWLQQDDFKNWLQSINEDDEKARCTVCSTTFNIKWDGIKAVKTHMETNSHTKNIMSLAHSSNLKKFLKSKYPKFYDQVTAVELIY